MNCTDRRLLFLGWCVDQVVNLPVARDLGITIPHSVLVRADEVIE